MEEIIPVENVKELKDKKIHRGFNGTCYITKDGEFFKLMEEPNMDTLEKLSKFSSPHFLFPKRLVYDKHGKLIGYVREYVDGDTIANIPSEFNLDKYTSEIEKIENEIAVLTNYKLHIVDAGVNNILYTNDGELRIIDTDFYEPNSTISGLYAANMKNVGYSLMYPVCDITKPMRCNRDLNIYMQRTLDGKMKPSDLIYEFAREIYLRGDYPEDSIGEFKKQVLKL